MPANRQNAGELPAASFHTVQFVAAGEEVATLFVVDGAAMTRIPRAPEIKGQSFEGWYCDGVEVDAQTPVLADMVVKAVYTAVYDPFAELKKNADFLYEAKGDYADISIFGDHKKNQAPSAGPNTRVSGAQVLEAWTANNIKIIRT